MNVLSLIPSFILVASVVLARISGNDKMPYFILFVIGLNLILGLLFTILFFLGKTTKIAIFVGFLPTIYALIVIILARNNLIDPFLFLGIK